MSKFCNTCTYLKVSRDWPDNNGYFWCDKRLKKVLATEVECSRYVKAYSRSNSEAESYYKYSQSKSSRSGCFITTVVCGGLGLPDDSLYLNVIRSLRDNYLQKRPDKLEILAEYDFIGPVIAKKIEEDEDKKGVSIYLFTNYLSNIINSVLDGKNEEATNEYLEMVDYLLDYYDLQTLGLKLPIPEDYSKCDIKKLGHARV